MSASCGFSGARGQLCEGFGGVSIGLRLAVGSYPREACDDPGGLLLVEPELPADLLAARPDVEDTAAPVIHAAHEFAIHVHAWCAFRELPWLA